MPAKTLGSLFVAIAALLWATDGVFRFPVIHQLDPIWVVLTEHAIATLFLIPFLFRKQIRKGLFALNGPQWGSAALIGAGGSALATLAFTASFRYVNPSVAILLQKLQPVLVVILAATFLKERPHRSFFLGGLVAFTSAILLSFPDLDFSFLKEENRERSFGVLLAVLASTLWAVSTVGGKNLLHRVSPWITTFWRYIFGLLTLFLIALFSSPVAPEELITHPEVRQSIFYMALFPGLISLVFYYQGLKRTTASVTTIVELLFPLGAVVLNYIYLDIPLRPVQWLAGMMLVLSVAWISRPRVVSDSSH